MSHEHSPRLECARCIRPSWPVEVTLSCSSSGPGNRPRQSDDAGVRFRETSWAGARATGARDTWAQGVSRPPWALTATQGKPMPRTGGRSPLPPACPASVGLSVPNPRGAAQRLQWVQASAPRVVPGDLAGLSVTRTPGRRSPHSRCHPRTCVSSGLLPLSPARTRSGCGWEVTELRTALWGDARLRHGDACHLGSRRGSSM